MGLGRKNQLARKVGAQHGRYTIRYHVADAEGHQECEPLERIVIVKPRKGGLGDQAIRRLRPAAPAAAAAEAEAEAGGGTSVGEGGEGRVGLARAPSLGLAGAVVPQEQMSDAAAAAVSWGEQSRRRLRDLSNGAAAATAAAAAAAVKGSALLGEAEGDGAPLESLLSRLEPFLPMLFLSATVGIVLIARMMRTVALGTLSSSSASQGASPPASPQGTRVRYMKVPGSTH